MQFVGYIVNVNIKLFKIIHIHENKKKPATLDSTKRKLGSREESEVACFFVFSHIRIMGYFRLG